MVDHMMRQVPWSDLLVSGEQNWTGGRGKRREYVIPDCRARGCSLLGDEGAGYCVRHSRNFYRTGHPEGMAVRRTEEFAEAMLAWADAEDRASLVKLLGATQAWVKSDAMGKLKSETPSGSVRPMLRAVWRYVEADTDQEFNRAWGQVQRLARTWWKGTT